MNSPVPNLFTFRFWITLGLGFCSPAILGQPAIDCADFFQGRSVRFVVATGAGGGYDLSARAVSTVFSDRTGARTQVANIVGGNGYLAGRAVRAGNENSLTIGLLSRASLVSPFGYNNGNALDDFFVLGILSEEPVAWMIREGYEFNAASRIPVASFDRHEAAIRWGLTAASLRLPVAAVLGHTGSADSSSALVRGDVDMAVYSLTRARRLLQQQVLEPGLILTDYPIDEFPDVPHLAGPGGLADQYSSDLPATERNRLLELAALSARLSSTIRAFYVSRNVKDQTRRCLTESFDAMLQGQDLAAAMANLDQTFNPVGSAESIVRLQQDLELMEQNRSLLESILEQVMR